MTPLKRQYFVKGEVCDILAINKLKQLVILELKNTEDRYVIQQLTRYYDNFLNEKPFSAQIDYNQPIHLIAAAPSFHKHNLIDRKYNLLKINLLQIDVLQDNEFFKLQLQDIDTTQTWSILIDYREINFPSTSSNIPKIPQLFLDWLGACTGEERQALIQLREKILSFDEGIQEEIEGMNTIRYSKGKSKPIAEICYQRTKNKPIVFLWLPTPTSRRKEVIGRIRLWLNGQIVTNVGHIPSGMGKMKLESEWNAMPREKRPGNYYHQKYLPLHAGIYNNFLHQNFQSPVLLEVLVDLALAKWLARI